MSMFLHCLAEHSVLHVCLRLKGELTAECDLKDDPVANAFRCVTVAYSGQWDSS
jgi:hypothetical protein